MRSAYPLALLWLLLSAASPLAQQNAGKPEPHSGSVGPVIDGRHRQPTAAEIESRERAEGRSAQAAQARAREQNKVIDDLYKELMTPVPSGAKSGQATGTAQ